MKRGDIYNYDLYLQSKTLDHSEWRLPRCITPSDIDMVFDNAGKILFCDLKNHHCTWDDLSVGQRKLYEAIVRNGAGTQFVALLHHSAPATQKFIRTVSDIEEFQLIYWKDNEIKVSQMFPGSYWRVYVEEIFYGIKKTTQDEFNKFLRDTGQM